MDKAIIFHHIFVYMKKFAIKSKGCGFMDNRHSTVYKAWTGHGQRAAHSLPTPYTQFREHAGYPQPHSLRILLL